MSFKIETPRPKVNSNSAIFGTWSESLEIPKPIKMRHQPWFFLSCILICTNSGRFGHFLKMGDARYWKSFGSTLYSTAMHDRVVIHLTLCYPSACVLLPAHASVSRRLGRSFLLLVVKSHVRGKRSAVASVPFLSTSAPK
jgi:hypothetical protein